MRSSGAATNDVMMPSPSRLLAMSPVAIALLPHGDSSCPSTDNNDHATPVASEKEMNTSTKLRLRNRPFKSFHMPAREEGRSETGSAAMASSAAHCAAAEAEGGVGGRDRTNAAMSSTARIAGTSVMPDMSFREGASTTHVGISSSATSCPTTLTWWAQNDGGGYRGRQQVVSRLSCTVGYFTSSNYAANKGRAVVVGGGGIVSHLTHGGCGEIALPIGKPVLGNPGNHVEN